MPPFPPGIHDSQRWSMSLLGILSFRQSKQHTYPRARAACCIARRADNEYRDVSLSRWLRKWTRTLPRLLREGAPCGHAGQGNGKRGGRWAGVIGVCCVGVMVAGDVVGA